MLNKVIKISATWCMPCHAYAKTFEAVKADERFKDIEFEELDAEENEELCEKYGVRSIPTTIMLDENGEVLLSFSGNVSKQYLEDKIEEISK